MRTAVRERDGDDDDDVVVLVVVAGPGVDFGVTMDDISHRCLSRDSYKVTVEVIDGLQFKGEQIVETVESETRLRRVINRHGLRVIVTQSGLVGFFDFQQLLIQMVTSMGLLAVANAVVNFIAMHLMELRHIYSKYETVTVRY